MIKNIKIIVFILLFCLLSLVTKSQSIREFHNNPSKYPKEFSILATEYIKYNENTYDYTVVDNNVYYVINNYKDISDIDILITLLTKNCKNDLEKARAFYIWITKSIVYDLNIRKEIPSSEVLSEEIAMYSFKKRRAVCLEISYLFVMMCKKSNIYAYTISGYANSDIDIKSLHAWSAFKYNNTFYFVDATFGLLTLVNDNDIIKNTIFFNMNKGFYKTYYYSTNIYGKLTTLGKIPRTIDVNWGLKEIEYKNINILRDLKCINLIELSNECLSLNTNSPNTMQYFPYFRYEYLNIQTMKKYGSDVNIKDVYKNDNHPTENSFKIINSKEYRKMTNCEKISYNKVGEAYYSYWITYYTKMNDVERNDIYSKKLIDLKFDYSYLKMCIKNYGK